MNITKYPDTPRLVNRFTLGADPEFTFYSPVNGYVYAENLGLNTTRAFGCDMAGRQAEVRAYPSRFALEVVASICDTLRWMHFETGKNTKQLYWLAKAYNGKDGCGGHVHFGRKQPDREKEIEALDSLTQYMCQAGVLDSEDVKARKACTHYGKLGDYRVQNHGYEYRSLPTQLDSPWLTYLVLVLSKLAVYDEGVTLLQKSKERSLSAKERLVALLIKYVDLDDDAAIAIKGLQMLGWPMMTGSNFIDRWGVAAGINKEQKLFYPSTIEGSRVTCEELFSLFTRGRGLTKELSKPNWEPFNLPNRFSPIAIQQHTLGHLPDVGMNLLARDTSVVIQVHPNQFGIHHSIALPKARIREALESKVGKVTFYMTEGLGERTIVVTVPSEFNKSLTQCKFLHDVLGDSTLFPVCKAKDSATVDWSRWDSPSAFTNKPLLGKKVEEILGVAVSVTKPKAPSIIEAQYSYALAVNPEPIKRKKIRYYEE